VSTVTCVVFSKAEGILSKRNSNGRKKRTWNERFCAEVKRNPKE
jgi:hypothetical protein